jgi:hypothetical protein
LDNIGAIAMPLQSKQRGERSILWRILTMPSRPKLFGLQSSSIRKRGAKLVHFVWYGRRIFIPSTLQVLHDLRVLPGEKDERNRTAAVAKGTAMNCLDQAFLDETSGKPASYFVKNAGVGIGVVVLSENSN